MLRSIIICQIWLILIMQQVIRSLQNKRLRQLERKKIQDLTPQQFFNNMRYHSKNSSPPHKVLQHQYQHLQNLSYNRLERISQHKIYPLSHMFAYQPLLSTQIKEEQERSRSMSENNQFLRHYNPLTYSKNKEEHEKKEDHRFYTERVILKAHSQTKKVRSKARKKLRAYFLSALFCVAIKTQLKEYMRARKQKCMNLGKMYVQQAMVSFQDYYYNLLQQQITQYILLLQKSYRYPEYDPARDVMRILTFMTNKLNNSPIPKSLLAALEITATNHCFYPFIFLFRQQVERMQFSSKWGCSIQIEKDESCMIGACFMGIGMLCYNLLFRPWLSEDLFRKKQKRQFKITAKYKQLKNLINGVASIIYFLVIDNFIVEIPVINRQEKQLAELLRVAQIKIAPSLKIVAQVEQQVGSSSEESHSEQESNSKQSELNLGLKRQNGFGEQDEQDEWDNVRIIAEQDRRFFNRLKQEFEDQMVLIEQNLKEWIIKAVLIAIKKVEAEDKQRKVSLYGAYRKR